MKKFIFAICLLGSLNVFAEQMTSAAFCSGTVRIPSLNVQGTCTNGVCTAYTFSEWLTASGNCNDGSYFTAETRTPSMSLTGQCINGRLSMRTDSQFYNWYGRCSNRGYFYAPSSYTFGNDVHGSCSDNGSFFGSTFMEYATLQAQCS